MTQLPLKLKQFVLFYHIFYTHKNIFRNYVINSHTLFNNKIRMQIISILGKESLNITELSKRLPVSYNSTLIQINTLREYNLIKESRMLFSQGREVILSTKGIDFQKNIQESIKNKRDVLVKTCSNEAKKIYRPLKLEQTYIIFDSVPPLVVDIGQGYAVVTPSELKENATP